jgi:competence protein ComEC
VQALPLLWLSLSFILGVLLGAWQPLHSAAWIGMAVVFLIFTFIEERFSWLRSFQVRWDQISPLPLGILLAVLMAGAARYQSVQPEFTPTDLVWYNGREVLLRAQVISFPETGRRSIPLRLDTDQLEIEGQTPQKVRGLLLAVLPPGEDWRYGDILLLQGRLAAPQVSGDFSYSDYLARQGIHAQIFFPRATLVARGQGSPIKAVLFALRNAADRTIKSIFPSPEAALLSGILLGLDGDLPLSLQNAFRDTGTSHIIAISGFNMTVTPMIKIQNHQPYKQV